MFLRYGGLLDFLLVLVRAKRASNDVTVVYYRSFAARPRALFGRFVLFLVYWRFRPLFGRFVLFFAWVVIYGLKPRSSIFGTQQPRGVSIFNDAVGAVRSCSHEAFWS